MKTVYLLLKVLVVGLFVNFGFVINHSVLAADGNTVELGNGVKGWCTALLPLGSGQEACFSSPLEACHKQWENAGGDERFPFYGYYPIDENDKGCDWDWYNAPLVTMPGGASVTFMCDYNYEFLPPNRCVKTPTEEHCTSTQGGSPTPTGGTNPILLTTGAKVEQELDFSTQDSLLQVKRDYRSFMAGKPDVYRTEPLGMGYGWRLSFLYELQLDPWYFEYNRKVSVFFPEGTSYDFQKQTDGALKSSDADANQVQFKLEFEGEWPADLNEVYASPSYWKLTLTNNQIIHFKTFKIAGSSSQSYSVGRPVEIMHPNGYSQTFHYGENGELTSLTDSYGRELRFTWIRQSTDPKQRPLAISKIELPDGNAIGYEYGMPASIDPTVAMLFPERLEKVKYLDTNGNTVGQRQYHYEDTRFSFYLTGITDERGQRVASWAYDGDGRAISSEGANGLNHFMVSYDDTEGAESRTVTNPLGKHTTYSFHREGVWKDILKLQETRQTQFGTTTTINNGIQYDDRGFIRQKTDEAGKVTRYTYNDRGLLESLTEGVGTDIERTTVTTWHPTLRLPTRLVAPGRETTNVYTAAGLLSSKMIKDTATNATRTTSYTYTPKSQLKTVDGSRTDVSDITTYAYDSHGNLNKITNALGQTTDITAHDGAGRPLSLVDANGVITQLQYDVRGRLISTTTNSKQILLTYDAAGNLQRITAPDGGFLAYGYDAASRLINVTDALGNKLEYTLDAKGNHTETRIKDIAGTLRNTQRSVYDDIDRVLRTIGSQTNQVTQFTYDNFGNIHTQTDARGNTTTNNYDALYRLTRINDALSGVTHYTYNSADNLTAITDPLGNTTRYTYNTFGEQTQEISPDRGTLTYTYDAAGNRTSKTDARGIVTHYRHDALNRLIAVEYPTTSLNVSFTYDQGQYGKDHLTRMQNDTGVTDYTYDATGNLIRETLTLAGHTWQTTYTYDAANQLTSTTYPSGRIVTNSRGLSGQISKITQTHQGKTEVLADTITYLPFGLEISRKFGNGLSRTQTYDLDYRLKQRSIPTVLNFTYTHDLVNNILGIEDGLAPAKNQSFTYDNLNRLKQASGSYGRLGYEYDAVGNRLKKTDGTKTENYTYATNSNRLLSRDGGLGEPVKAIVSVYGDHNRLNKVTVNGQDTTYQYNGKGERVSKTRNGVTTRYHYDQEGHLIAESQGNTITAEYIYLNGEPLAFVSQDAATQPVSYVHTDHLGTPKALTNTSKTVIWRADQKPFGESTIQGDPDGDGKAVTFNLRFPGQYFDQETELHYNYFRDYDPTLGRYMESDPIGINGGINIYAYVENDPINRNDPEGLESYQCTKPLHAIPWAYGVPLLYHQYSCIIRDGKTVCGGQDRSGSALGSLGLPSSDSMEEGSCKEIRPDDNCFEKCLTDEWKKPRPWYAIGPTGTDCQEYDYDVNKRCQKQCGTK